MTRLPVIVGFGGYNAAGRSSFHHAFRRTVFESLDSQPRQEALAGLGIMTQVINSNNGQYQDTHGNALSLQDIENQFAEQILQRTLIRKIEPYYFDVDNAACAQKLTLIPNGSKTSFLLGKKQLPSPIPASWKIEEADSRTVRVTLLDNHDIKVASKRGLTVKTAGQLPSGFDPAHLYPSRFHPRGLQLAIIGISDALHSMGIAWETIVNAVHPDEISVHSGSCMGQLDEFGFGGMLQARTNGGRASAKQCPLGMTTMPADFINAYVLGSVGTTGSLSGACATYLYNLKAAVEEIQAGKTRVAIVGNSEAPIVPEIIEGYAAMGALATWDGLKKVQGKDTPDDRLASRPFGDNCGFTLAESTQYTILMDDELALALGAQIYGAVTDVFVNADGYKKSISAPGPGNYITLAKAVAAASQLIGRDHVRHHSFVHAHGSSTPVNRVTESEILNRIAGTFGIEQWPIAAVKAYVGHSLGPASGDQLISALGTFKFGIIPGIKTLDKIADDVHRDNLLISSDDISTAPDELKVAFLNAKGFGGNNATAVVLSPGQTLQMLQRRHDQTSLSTYLDKRALVEEAAARYDQQALHGNFNVVYSFGESLIDDAAIGIDDQQIKLPGYHQPIELNRACLYEDMVPSDYQ